MPKSGHNNMILMDNPYLRTNTTTVNLNSI